ncbi:unnamed protein product, partial [Discosporangium mesarthrocarpum]
MSDYSPTPPGGGELTLALINRLLLYCLLLGSYLLLYFLSAQQRLSFPRLPPELRRSLRTRVQQREVFLLLCRLRAIVYLLDLFCIFCFFFWGCISGESLDVCFDSLGSAAWGSSWRLSVSFESFAQQAN